MEEKDFSFKLIFPLQGYESQLLLLNEKWERKLYHFYANAKKSQN